MPATSAVSGGEAALQSLGLCVPLVHPLCWQHVFPRRCPPRTNFMLLPAPRAAITSDPANAIAVKLFGEAGTDTLLKMATGHPAVAS